MPRPPTKQEKRRIKLRYLDACRIRVDLEKVYFSTSMETTKSIQVFKALREAVRLCDIYLEELEAFEQ